MKITEQAIFNAAWQHFIVEGSPPSVEFHTDPDTRAFYCMYLASDGNKCAVGLVIPDGHKIQGLHNVCLSALVRGWPDMFDPDLEHSTIQSDLHDDLLNVDGDWGYGLAEMESKYAEFALENGLTVPE